MATTRDDRGFTVLRLVVIVCGAALLVAIVGVGVGTRHSVADESAKRKASAAGDAASMYAAETGKAPTAADLETYQPSLDYETLDPVKGVAVQGKVYVRTDGQVAELASRAGDTCFWVQRTSTTTRYAKGSCDGDPADLVFRDHW